MNELPLAGMLGGMAYALIITCLVEGTVTLVFMRSAGFLLFNFRCNVITNPLLNFICMSVFYLTRSIIAYRITVGAGEIIVLFAETLLYKKFDGGKRGNKEYFFLSAITNLASFLSGILINFLR